MAWKTIPGLPMYEASDDGAIRSKSRSVQSHIEMKTYRKVIPGKVLEPRLRVTNGKAHYMDVKINGVNYYVHRLVALAWHHDTWFAGAEVNHINGDKYDNRASNLEWITHSGNLKHSYRVLGRKPTGKRKNTNALQWAQDAR